MLHLQQNTVTTSNEHPNIVQCVHFASNSFGNIWYTALARYSRVLRFLQNYPYESAIFKGTSENSGLGVTDT